MDETLQGPAGDAYLLATFLLGEATFGVRAEEVQEVVRPGKITRVHNAPAYVVGIRNLRGRIVTVIDLAMRLALGQVDVGSETRILIMDWQGEPVGLMVDQIADIISVSADGIEPPPANVHGVRARNLRGVCRSNERLAAILDLGTTLDLNNAD